MIFSRLSLTIAIFLTSVVFAQEPDANWTQWRGNLRDSQVSGSWPAALDESKLKQIWRKEMGPSYSGPIVLGDQVFVTETRNKQDEVVFGLNVETGEENWNLQWPGSMRVPMFAAKNGSWIRSTPATDGERLYVAGILGRFVCIDVAKGTEVWAVDFSKQYGVKHEDFGQVCSPLIIDSDEKSDPFVYIQCSAGFIKFNRLTGEEIWRTLYDGGSMMSRGAFSSPYVATVAGKKQILVQTRTHLNGVDLESGKTLWQQPVPNFRGMNILTPTVYGDTVFTSSYNHQSFGFEVAKSDAGFVVNEKWTAASKAYMSSPVVIGDNAYLHLQNKRVASINLKSGETNWVSKQRFGSYWSMVANGDKILALDSKGKLILIHANPEKFDIVGEAKLQTNDSWAHLAVVGDRIFVRGIDSMAVYQWQN